MQGQVRQDNNAEPRKNIITRAKRDADALKSPINVAPGTPATSEVSVRAEVHGVFTDAEGFTVDRTTRKKMIKAKRRDPKYASTPKDNNEITVLSTGKVSPAKKKQKRASGTMNIKQMFHSIFKAGADKSEEPQLNDDLSGEKETTGENNQPKQKKEKAPKTIKKDQETKVCGEEETMPKQGVSSQLLNAEVVSSISESNQEVVSDLEEASDIEELEACELEESVILKATDEDGDNVEEVKSKNEEDGDAGIDSWSVKQPKGFISREYEGTLSNMDKQTFRSDVHVIGGSNLTGLRLKGDEEFLDPPPTL